MVRAAIPRGAKKLRRHACDPSAADAEHYGAASRTPLCFQAPGHDAGQGRREVYRYARRLADSPVCICPIRGAENASARPCCALYGYVSGSHVVHGPHRKSGQSRVARSARWRLIDARRVVLRIAEPKTIVLRERIAGHGDDCGSRTVPTAASESATEATGRTWRWIDTACRDIPICPSIAPDPCTTRCVRIDRVAYEDAGKCVVWPGQRRRQRTSARFAAPPVGGIPLAC